MYVHELAHARPHPEDAPLVVIVHGSLDRHRSFLRVRGRLREFRVVVYDRRGYSRSREATPRASGVADHVADLLAIVDDRPAVALGHSYGAVVALAAAATRPDVLKAVVAYEPPLPWLDFWHADGIPGSRNPYEGMDTADAAEHFVRRMIGGGRYERLPAETRQSMRDDGPALVTELTALRRDPPPFDPALVEVPVVVGLGSESSERHRLGAAWLMQRLARPELAIIEGAGHGAHLSHPEELARLVVRAIDLAKAELPGEENEHEAVR